ncbi:hypothetical protein Hanom_Chr16g01425691 [Helianthus anomalus]
MRLMYAIYLDVLVYYHKFKSKQQRVYEKQTVKNVVDVTRSRSQEALRQKLATATLFSKPPCHTFEKCVAKGH